MAAAQMSARDEILSTLRKWHTTEVPRPAPYRPPEPASDLVAAFATRARFAAAEVTVLDSADAIPGAVAEILRARNLQATIHLPPDPRFDHLAWTVARETRAPGPDDAALAFAPFGIAETGTLAYPAHPDRPASWHYRAGLEIAILQAGAILPHLEDVVARVKAAGALPHTINLVTGPSRTGDIEQTLELGAHGPKALVILIVPDPELPANREISRE
jgi:L-lactate dehydrogenase complex protein LldG